MKTKSEPTVQCSIRMPASDAEFCKALGGAGGLSAGVRACVQQARVVTARQAKLEAMMREIGRMTQEIHQVACSSRSRSKTTQNGGRA